MSHGHSLPLVESQGRRSMQKCAYVYICYISIQCGVLWLLIDGRGSRFHCYIISCQLARRGVQRGAAEANRQRRSPCSAFGRGIAVGVTSILGRGQFISWETWNSAVLVSINKAGNLQSIPTASERRIDTASSYLVSVLALLSTDLMTASLCCVAHYDIT